MLLHSCGLMDSMRLFGQRERPKLLQMEISMAITTLCASMLGEADRNEKSAVAAGGHQAEEG